VQATTTQELDRSLVRSVAWNTVCDWTSQVVSWASFLVVMRLLTPADFGIAAMAALLLPYMQQMTTFGIARAIIALRDLSEDQLAQLSTVSFLSAVALLALSVPCSPLLAAFFKTPQLSRVLIISCLGLIPLGLQVVPSGVLARDLRFRLLSLCGAAQAASSAIVTLAMAYFGCGYWALVVGNVAGTVVRMVLVLKARPCKLALPKLRVIREPLTFCRQLVVSTLAFSSYQRIDNFTAGKVLGQSALGLYGSAWALANVPLEKITTLVVTVIPSYLAAIQDQPSELRRYLRTLTEAVALAAFPATVGLGLIAHELVPFAFGHKWDGMIRPLQVLSFYAAFRSVAAIPPKLLTSIGNARTVMWNDLLALILLPVAFYLGSFRGIAGIAWGWVAAYPLVALPIYRKTFQTIGMRTTEYIRALLPALEATAAMILAVVSVKHGFPATWPLPLRLLTEIAAGATAYMVALVVRHRDRMTALISIAASAWTTRSQSKLPQVRSSEVNSKSQAVIETR